ncbi:MAG: protein kinase domain-containing protein [Ardenticatenaceae bacterium]
MDNKGFVGGSESGQASPVPHFGHYEVLDELGRGGFGTVYLALDLRLERMVALKVLHANLVADSTIASRFKREAKALARLTHPNIVMVLSVEDEPPPPFIVMEYVDGQTLERKLMNRAWGLKEAIHILWQVGEALDAAHEQGLIHRDVKPSNILITREKQVKLTDFGIAKMRQAEQNTLTATNVTLGTLQYMAPEQSDINRQHSIGPAVDIYALGVVAYEMLAGRVPFKGDTHAVLLAHHIELPPDPSTWGAEVSPSVLRVLRQVLAKDPAERYATATQFVEALAQAGLMDGIDLDLEGKPHRYAPLMASDSAEAPTRRSVDPSRAATKRPTRPLSDRSEESWPPSPKKGPKEDSKRDAPTRQWVTPQESRGSAYDAAEEIDPYDQPISRRQQTPSQNPPRRLRQTPSQNPPSHRQQTPTPSQYPPSRRPPSVPPEEWADEASSNQPISRRQQTPTPSQYPPRRRQQTPTPSQNPPISRPPSVPQEQWADEPSHNQATVGRPSRQPARELPPVRANHPVSEARPVRPEARPARPEARPARPQPRRSIIWGAPRLLGRVLGSLGWFLMAILRRWRLALFAGLLLLAVMTFRNLSLPEVSQPELSGPEEIVSQWQEDLAMWWQETVVQPWNEFRTGVESEVTEEITQQWAEQGGVEGINKAITDTLTVIETVTSNFPEQNAPPTAPPAPTDVATSAEGAPTEITVPPTYPFRGTFVGPDFSQGCAGFYVLGYVRDQDGNLLSGVRIRVVNQQEANTEITASREEPLGWYDVPISEKEAYWDVQVVDADNNPLSEIVTIKNSGNYVEGSEACRHQVDFEQVN